MIGYKDYFEMNDLLDVTHNQLVDLAGLSDEICIEYEIDFVRFKTSFGWVSFKVQRKKDMKRWI